ncbi:MAG: hypothetical protein KTQ13_08960 [Ferruginibacter sp.]|nr:hypothetical protein [Chitinophagaceae bacterium]MBP6287691.1 hypothetical protein [Ferruginibacter sp.]MBU9936768.1 hypothetical protein [Ferruginibacter sp.]
MLKIFLHILFSFLSITAFSQAPDCSRFREGKFRVADTEAGVITIAERKGMYQTESSESLKAVVRFRITWQNNCSFTLKLDKVLRNENRIDFPPNMEVRVRILETSADSYIQEISSSLANSPYKVKVTKVN